MAERKLVDKLSFENTKVFLDGDAIFTVPGRERSLERGINLLGVDERSSTIYVGTGKCCYGYVFKLEDSSRFKGNYDPTRDVPNYELASIRAVDFNVYDILPIKLDPNEDIVFNGNAFIVSGYGCAGSGVRMVSDSYPVTKEIVSGEEFADAVNGCGVNIYRDRLRSSQGRIYFDLLRGGVRPKPGMKRNPSLPSILMDASVEEVYTTDDIFHSIDITDKIAEFKVDFPRTFDAINHFWRVK